MVDGHSQETVDTVRNRAWGGNPFVAFDLSICIESAQLPAVHDDPCDGFIIATARLHRLPVVTADETFEKYGVDVIF